MKKIEIGNSIHNLGGGMIVSSVIFDCENKGLVEAKHEVCPNLKMIVNVNIWDGELWAV